MAKKLINHLLLAVIVLVVPVQAGAEPASSGLIISEVKLGGSGTVKEYIEIYNDSAEVVDLAGYSLEYAKAGFATSSCQSASWKAAASTSSQVLNKPLSGLITPGGFIVIEVSMTDVTSGSARLIDNTKSETAIVDLVGWGDTSPCYSASPTKIPLNGQSVKRSFTKFGLVVSEDQRNDAKDFAVELEPLPGNDHCFIENCLNDVQAQEYLPLIISELLPDPDAPKVDSQDEFIELFNPGQQSVQAKGYVLTYSSGSSTSKYTLPELDIGPEEYLVLFSGQTGIGLANTKSGQVTVADPAGQQVHQTEPYPATIKANQSWALINDQWYLSDLPTPGRANQLHENITGSEPEPELEVQAACPAGKHINPATGRCKSLPVLALTLGCKAGQSRNPDTGRCRKAVTQRPKTKCQTGQFLNPETGRCRKIETSASKDCASGYYRHPETNRCRKQPNPKSSAKPTQNDSNNHLNVGLLTVSSVMLGGYAAYEYRTDLLSRLAKAKTKLIRR